MKSNPSIENGFMEIDAKVEQIKSFIRGAAQHQSLRNVEKGLFQMALELGLV